MPKARIPKSLRIGFQTYKVTSSKKADEWLIEASLAGRSNGNLGQIEVRSNYPLAGQTETLLHEVLHQVLFVAGQTNEDAVEEHIVRAMAMGLMQVLRDNPEFVAYLTQE